MPGHPDAGTDAAAAEPEPGPAPGRGPSREDIVERARTVLNANWRSPGFCVPNPATYPWQWLWDSCFHAVCWAHLGEGDRAVTELDHALANQAADGFVPHMTYWSASGRPDDTTHESFWGRPATSSITQPPMYGHAIAELVRHGVAVPDALVERAGRGLRFLIDVRGRAGLGPVIVHPWESGCDDSPRWDAWCSGGWDPDRWKQTKGDLVEAVHATGADRLERSGSPVASSAFEVAAAGFGALVAFNAAELAEVTQDTALEEAADRISCLVDERWSASTQTWTDRVLTGPTGSSAARTVEALLGVLVSRNDDAIDTAFDLVGDGRAFGARFGPTGVHRDEPTFDPRTYWRGPAWPQLTYLLWTAARRAGRTRAVEAAALRSQLMAGTWQSGFAEYWEPDTGEGLGAAPQSWTALAAVVA